MGNEAWTLKLDWAGGDGFRAAPQKDWAVAGSSDAAGLSRSYGGLTFLQVYEAGHMVSAGVRPYMSSDVIAAAAATADSRLVGQRAGRQAARCAVVRMRVGSKVDSETVTL